MEAARCTHRTRHAGHLKRLRLHGGAPLVVHPPRDGLVPPSRPARESDPLCPCGRPALVIFTTKDFGDVIWCGA
jgi:hypothetical protein